MDSKKRSLISGICLFLGAAAVWHKWFLEGNVLVCVLLAAIMLKGAYLVVFYGMARREEFSARVLVLVSIVLFCISLTQRCMILEGSKSFPCEGLFLLIFGWLGLLGYVICWAANPLMAIGCGYFFERKYYKGTWLTGIAVLVMLSFLLYKAIPDFDTGHIKDHRILGYGWGYWLWVSSGVALLLANVLALKMFGDDSK